MRRGEWWHNDSCIQCFKAIGKDHSFFFSHPVLLFDKNLSAEKGKFSLQYVKLRWLKSLSNHKWLWKSGSSNLERSWPFCLVKWCVSQLLVSYCWYFWRQTDWLHFFLGSSNRRCGCRLMAGAYIQNNIGKHAIYLVNNLCLAACDHFNLQLCIRAVWT